MHEIVTGLLSEINFAPATEVEEILQNVRCILSTTKFSVPLDRDFGLDATYLDKPLEVAKAKMASDIVLAISEYEPRVTVSDILFEADLDGILKAKVQVVINEI